jgi:outer membrane protein assembly factor BamB
MLTALDPQNGLLKWSLPLNEAVEYTSPQQLGKDIYIGGREGSVFCVGAESGQVQWKRSSLGRIRAGLSASNEAICVGTDQYLYALDPESGEVKWRAASIGHNPVQKEGRVYFLSASGEFTVRDAASGEMLAKAMLERGTLWTAPVVLEDRVLVPAYAVLYCVERGVATP